MPAEAIKNFDEEAAINIILNTFHDTYGLINCNPTFNAIDNLADALEENKKLYDRYCKLKEKKMNCCKHWWMEKNNFILVKNHSL